MTKKIKSLLAIMMALVMILSASIGSSKVLAAGGNGEIKITGATEGKSYSIYKIFDAVKNGDAVSYTVSSEWKSFFSGDGKKYLVAENTGNLNQVEFDGAIKYINITEENVKDFAKDANAVIKTLQAPESTHKKVAGVGILEFTNLPLGYYLVHPEGATEAVEGQNSVVSLTSVTPNAEVKVKGTYPIIEKEVEEKSYDYGKEISYTLKGNVPDATGYKAYKYIITDELSEGLTLKQDSVKVYIDNAEQIEHVTLTKEANKLVAKFAVLNLQDKAGKEIKITYTASLNEKAVIGKDGNSNKVELEYTNNPHDENDTDKVNKEKKVYTAAIKVLKHKDGDEGQTLEGAKFKLKNSKGKFYKLENNVVSWVDEADADEKETRTDGVVEFKGLENGTYHLVETKAPDGYNKLTDPVEVKVNYQNQTSEKYQEVKVPNKSGVELPGVGGMGTTLFTILGGGVILIALYSLAKGKVKKERN